MRLKILSGVFEGKRLQVHLFSMVVWNKNQKSKDYSEIASYYRPGMLTFALMRNTASETTEAEVVLRDARQ